jgi:hypothetical protein
MKKGYGWTDELKDERLLRPWEWMRMRDERGALKNVIEERTDWRTSRRTNVCWSDGNGWGWQPAEKMNEEYGWRSTLRID